MVTSVLQRRRAVALAAGGTQKAVTGAALDVAVGETLLEFLEFFGLKFDRMTQGISVRASRGRAGNLGQTPAGAVLTLSPRATHASPFTKVTSLLNVRSQNR